MAAPTMRPAAGDNVYLSLKRTYEQDLKTKILGALCFIPNVTVEAERGAGPPTIHPHQAGPTLCSGRPTRQPPCDRRGAKDDRPAAREPRPSNRIRPRSSAICWAAPAATRKRRNRKRTEPVSRVQVEKESVGLTPTVAGVSVGVPISYFKKVWQERNPAEPGRPPKRPIRPRWIRFASRNRRRSNGTWPNCSRRSKVRPKRRNWSP